MTSTRRALRTAAMAAAIAFYASAAPAQSAGTPPARDHQDHTAAPSQGGSTGMAGMPHGAMARIAALDTRIQTLAADMNMFVGEMKIETMAELLTAMVERQSLMRGQMMQMQGEMMQMQGGMMRRMMERGAAATASTVEAPAAIDEEPGGLCAPTP